MTLTAAATLIAVLLIFASLCFALSAFCNMIAALCYLASIRTPAGPRDEMQRSTVVNVNNGPAEFHELPPGFMSDDPDDIEGEEWKANPR
jgi:hypothetical protein